MIVLPRWPGHRDCDFMYSDEQCINRATGVIEAFFKPQWSPDLLPSTNYIGRFWCASRELLERTEGIRQIPSVLCRATPTGLDSEAGMKQSLARAIERRGIDGQIIAGYRPGTYRLKRRVSGQDLVSIIISTCASRGLIRTCVDTLRKTTAYRNFEIIGVDNIPAADHQAKSWRQANADRVVEIEGPFNWAYFNNRGAAAAAGQLLLFLNDDVEIINPGWLDALIEHAQRPEVGVVGAQLLYPEGTVQHGGMFLAGLGHARHAFRHRRHDDPGYFGLALTQRNVTAVTGACLMTRRETFLDLGGFNEAHDITNNDLDYCLKARSRGLLCVFAPHARLVHHERGSRADTSDHYDQAGFSRQWWPLFGEGDPYHHPRLSREVDDLAPEPEPVAGGPLLFRASVRNILAVKLDHIGDCIGSIRAIRWLRQGFPQARIHVLGGAWSEAVWSLAPEVDEFIAFDFFQARPLPTYQALGDDDLRRLAQRLEPYRFDLAIDLRRHGDTRSILQYTGARYLAGFKQGAEFPWLDISVEWKGDLPGVAKRRHFRTDLVNLVDAVAAECEPTSHLIADLPTARPPSARLELLANLDRPLICVHPAAGDEILRWPAAYFAELIDMLVERDGVHVAIVGVAGDSEIAIGVLRAVRNRNQVSNLAGIVEFHDLVALLSVCALFVGNNSGPKHLAAGLGVPTVGIHSGNVDPREWGPAGRRAVAVWRHVHCSPCHFIKPEQCDRKLACLTGLRPVDVYPVCKRFLAIRSDPTPLYGTREVEHGGSWQRHRFLGNTEMPA